MPISTSANAVTSDTPTWHRCHAGVPLNDKWSKMVRTFDVHDGITGLPLPGSPLSFIFGDQDTKDKWPALVQAKLKASGLDAYLRLGTESAVDGDIQQEGTVDFWQIDQPLRVFIGGFEETERAARWSCALRDASGADMTLAQALEASIQPPTGGSGKCTVQCTLRDQATRRIIRQWNCELAYDAADNLLARIDTLASSIEANIQVRHAVHDHGKALKARGNMETWTLRLPTALGLELTLANAPSLWTACHSGIPLNDKWSKMVRTFDVHDGLTGLPLPGSPLSFIFGDQDTKDKWPAMVQAKLKASGLDAYLRLGTESAVDGDIQQEGTVDFWQIDQPLRVFIGGFEETERAARWSCALRDASGADMTLAQAMEASIRPPTGGSGKCTVQCTLRDQTTQGIIRQWTCELAYEASDDPLARIGTLSSSIEANIHVRHVVHDFGKALTSKNDKASWTLQLPADLQLELTLHPAGTVATAPLYEDLPDMTGFEDDTLGADDCLWASRTYVLADRDLLVGEKILAWAVDPIDGRLLKSVTVTGTEENRARAAWPAALVRAIQADKTWVAHSVLLQAGHVSPDAELAVAAQSTSSTQFAAFDVVKKATVDRLWAFDSHCRVFSNAPFKANQVAAVRLPQAAPAAGDRVCVQIRHRTSQWLYESHVFTPHPKADQATWSEPLCEFLNTHSSMLRAGQLAADGITISPGKNDNTLWIPQLSELSVHVESIGWLKHEIFTPSTELTTEVVIAVHDDVTGAPLPGSPFKFTPSTESQSLENWPPALAEQLATSELAEYLKFEKTSAGQWTWWRAGVPLRIWMNAPFGAPDEWDDWGHDVDEVLRRMIESKDVELVIESHDARTGLLCHHSTIARTALSSDPSEEKKLVELKRCVAEHLKANGIFGGASSIGSGQGSGLPQGGCGAGVPLAQLVTALTADSTKTSELEKLEIIAPKHLVSEHINTQLKDAIFRLGLFTYTPSIGTESFFKAVRDFFTESFPRTWNTTGLVTLEEARAVFRKSWHLLFWHGPKCLDLSDIAERLEILKEFTSQKSSKHIPEDQRLSLAQQNTQISIRLKAHLTDPYDIRFIRHDTEISAARQVQATNRMEIRKYLPPHAHVNFTSASIGIPTTEPVPKALSILLDATAASQGFGFISCRPAEDGLSLGLHASFEAEQDGTTAGIRVGITSSTSLWEKIQACTAHQYIPTTPISNDTLCADMANTQGSALFATTPSQLSGVSAQTGLFHAHYPIATLCGLSGKGPSIDLGLNYSPLRANESGLGDGWAFTFSSYDNRSQVLALSNGTVDELTANDIKVLLDPAQGCLTRGGYTIKNAAGNSTTHKAGSLEQEVYALTGLTIE
ncbi:hypothetical protein IAE37_000121 [Pseudomonas sp. S31]|uniref:hypothetical protein n=1 Tax=Pseudomonas sp. S31 TaxID=1564473 RepID=UPI001913BF34|nr:hypothetical protein [Pseudomonas sp. S31]MBK4997845.1 hypothetical protein [Pseudomonas sp. S31]